MAIALCMENEGATNTPEFRANVIALAQKLGVLDDGLLKSILMKEGS